MALEVRRIPREVRRAVMLSGMRGSLFLSRALPPRAVLSLGSALGALAGGVPPLHLRLQTNLTHGLGGEGQVPPGAARRWFRNLGLWFGWSMATYHHGLRKSTLPERMSFDSTIAHLDDAVARGRGVILATPHQFGHEMAGGYISGRHQVVAVVREGKSRSREAMKRRWYEATGMEVVRRPQRSSMMADTFACLRALKSGRVLAITPDIIVKPDSGIPVRMMGRTVCLSPGVVVLAMKARAPLVNAYFHWGEDGRMLLRFGEPVEYPQTGDRDRTISEGLQAWCNDCEEYFRQHPENWLFWLDKRWTRALRTPPGDGPPA